MEEYRVKITPYANSQMREIREYIAVQLMNPDAAKNLLLNMREQISKLKNMPGKIKPIDEEPWGSQGVRKIIVGNFYIYYWIEEELLTVHIIAVAYRKREQKRVLSRIPNNEF